jgi:hypothetical protein
MALNGRYFINQVTIMSNTRRTFFMQSLSCATAPLILTMASGAQAQNQTAVADTDPQAIALGYQTESKL